MARITLQQANTIIEAALAKGAELGLKPLAVAVLDVGGTPIALQRQDGAPPALFHVAVRKAAGALTMGASSRKIAEISAANPAFLANLLAFAPVIAAAGGLVILQDEEQVGAIGVTGDTGDNDELAAMAGLAAVGLRAL